MGYDYTDIVFPLEPDRVVLTKSGEVVRMSATDKYVLLFLSFRAGNPDAKDNPNVAWPGFGEIASRTGLTRRAVMYSVQVLEELGLLKIEHPSSKKEPSSNTRKTNLYTLQMHALVAAGVAPVQERPKRKYPPRKPKPETTNLNFEDEEDGLSADYPKGTALLNFTEADADLS